MKSTDLDKLKCEPCSGNTKKLSKKDIEDNLEKLNDWKINDEYKMIFKKFLFKDFNDSLKFANLIGKIADKEGHHPDISIGYRYCLVMIHTHAIDNLSINDFVLAYQIDKLS